MLVRCKKCGAEMLEIDSVVHVIDTGHSRYQQML